MVKRILSIVLILVLSLPCFVFAAPLPEYYNSDNVLSGKTAPVRTQGEYSNCWAVAATGAVEYSMIVNDGGDFSKKENLFSEYHMTAAMSKTDDRFFNKYSRGKIIVGNRESAVAYLARGAVTGPVKYNHYKRGEYELYLKNIFSYKMLAAEKRQATLTKARFLTSKDEASSCFKYENGVFTYGKNTDVINRIKEGVVSFGAVAVSYYTYEYDEKTYFNPETGAYCVPWEDYINSSTPDGNCIEITQEGCTFKDKTNHTVLIVGWDDSYSWKNFKNAPLSFDGEVYTPEDGAWIVKNSWGEDFANGGYEYISYMDPTIGHFATVYEMEKEYFYKEYSHTPKGLMNSIRFPEAAYGVYAVNRFADCDGVIRAIGFYVCDTNIKMQFAVDTEPEKEPESFTGKAFEDRILTLVDCETGEEGDTLTFEYPGYYMYKLKTPVTAENGFDLYMRCLVDERRDIIMPAGNDPEGEGDYVENATMWSHVDKNGNAHKWKSIALNWCFSAFYTHGSLTKMRLLF